ncbi:type II toxin-antitoxin system HicA family toxin [Bradyrhizobium manausense]|uniref:type II toxin-antitoxin system HicA family toxin n=1 Tax=Bradyrhizobium manausense TaxID=989370 RepID=UPI001BA78061|nr:type II toxin-antitoxin system HicA family toxin [Bradyrhizobium manausense]
MPHLKCTFREFIEILERALFVLARTEATHRRYVGKVDGLVRNVTVAFHNINDDIKPETLASMIRQSGLPKHLFRK